MPQIVEQGDGWRRMSDGSLQMTKRLIGALSILAGEIGGYQTVQGDDDDDSLEGDEDDDSLEGDEDNEFGADKKKKKNGLFSSLFGNKKKPAKTGTTNGGQSMQVPKKLPFKPAFLTGKGTSTQAETITLSIRPQEDFHASTIHFDGSLTGASVTEIKFGAKTIYAGDGIDIDIFKAANPVGELLKNTSIKAGLDILIKMEMPGAGTGKVLIRGLSPANSDRC